MLKNIALFNPKLSAALVLTAALLAACGGGGGGTGGNSGDGAGVNSGGSSGTGSSGSGGSTSAPLAAPTDQSASRLLAQATYGATTTDIARVKTLGWEGWLNEQFAAPSVDGETYAAYVDRGGLPGCKPGCTGGSINTVMEAIWRQTVLGPDQLRQRATFALSQIFVVGNSVDQVHKAYSEYYTMLNRNAFGNFRTLLEEVSRQPTMGRYLSHLGNEKEDPNPNGRIPDQNYAREVMQLFSIGLWQLNDDGSRKKDSSGKDIPTYGQAEVVGMSRVFTGWSWGDNAGSPVNTWEYGYRDNHHVLMKAYPAHHSSSSKFIINGKTIAANTGPEESLKIALDELFNHPNVGPFIGKQLIQRLVTSNPSPEYVTRVTHAFNNNGSGVRGDMKAVWRAILLDPEARDMNKVTDSQWGKLREPLLRYGHFLRTFGVTSDSGNYAIWNLEAGATSIGQNPLRSPSVFNWYRPDYSPPGALFRAGKVAPEFQITHETTTAGYTNFIVDKAERETARFQQAGSRNKDALFTTYTAERALADRPAALLDHLNLLLMAGQMRPALRSRVEQAITAIPLTNDTDRYRRVSTAVALLMASPQYLIQK